ncbi:MAG: DMT family transporter [Nitratireductor sp.]
MNKTKKNETTNANTNIQAHSPKVIFLAFIALVISPAFFSSNIIFGKMALHIAPFTLAFMRWFFTALILVFLTKNHHAQMLQVAKRHWQNLIVMGILAMLICGGVVYWALQSTSATNGTLIYTLPPLIIILIERIWRKRPIGSLEMVGVFIAIFGVCIIFTRASLSNLLTLTFNVGDLMFLICAISWAIYTVMLKSEIYSKLETLPFFALGAIFGSFILFPFSAYEFLNGQTMPSSQLDWTLIAGMVILSSLLSFSLYQFVIKILGASIAGVSLYLLTPYGVGAAWFFLNESLQSFHWMGIVTILLGLVLATFPANKIKSILSKKKG